MKTKGDMKIKRSVILTVVILTSSLLSTGCGSSTVSKDFEAGMNACAELGALDQLLQADNAEVDYQKMVTYIADNAQEASSLNQSKYSQLALLATIFQDSVKSGNERLMLDLVALEGECSNLGMWAN
jgi:uncharacterized lipoprotein YehR (DUF1307 family)